MMTINGNLFPKEGYYFLEQDNVRISADGWPGVIARVKNYRARAGLPPGNPDVEVVEQACKRNPGLCRQDNQVYSAQLKTTNLKTRIFQWFAAIQKLMQSEPLTFSNEKDARDRAQTCSTCPFNKSLPQGCATCKQAVDEARKSIIGGRFQDARIHECDVLAEDLNVSRWIEQVRLENGELPGFCWRKRQL